MVNSEKKENLYTRKFGRIKLGSYGIAFVSLRLLGNRIEIYSRQNKNEETLYRSITIEDNTTVFSKIEVISKCSEVNYDTGCTLVIKGCKILRSNFNYDDLLKSKLSYLPISDNFKIYLYDKEIKRFSPDPDSFNMKFNFKIDKFEFNAEIFYEPKVISNKSYRGVFLEVDGRIIDWNIYNAIRHSISSPGIVDYRINGYIRIENNEFRDKINASRNRLNDYNLAMNIENMLKKNIGNIKAKAYKYYGWDNRPKKNSKSKENNTQEKPVNKNISTLSSSKMAISERPKFYKINERIEMAEKRLRNCNGDLKRLGVKFHYDAENEIETIIIAVQLWQLGLLDINLIQAITNDSPDGIIVTKNNELKFIEFEKSLSNFFIHDHDYNKTNYILCWDANMSDIEKVLKKVANKFSRYIESICYDNEKCEIKVNDCDGTCCKIKVYVLSKIIKYMKV